MKTVLDQDEEVSKSLNLFGSMLVMDGEDVVTIICKRATPCGMAIKVGKSTLWLFPCGGYVKRSKCKESSPMTMFKWKQAKDHNM
jgi:hypothetical protein